LARQYWSLLAKHLRGKYLTLLIEKPFTVLLSKLRLVLKFENLVHERFKMLPILVFPNEVPQDYYKNDPAVTIRFKAEKQIVWHFLTLNMPPD